MNIDRLPCSQWARLKRIRLLALRDAPQAFGTTLELAASWTDEIWRQQVRNLPTFIATIDAMDVGMARCVARASTTDAELISMWVTPGARGKQVGERLVEAVSEWASDAGFARLLLNVVDDNLPAIALYERLNFRPTGETCTFAEPRSHVTEHRRARTL